MENPTRSGGRTQENSLFLGLKPQCMNPGQKASKEELVAYEVLHHLRGISMVHEELLI